MVCLQNYSHYGWSEDYQNWSYLDLIKYLEIDGIEVFIYSNLWLLFWSSFTSFGT